MATVKPVVKLTKEGLMPANDNVSIGANDNKFEKIYADEFVGNISIGTAQINDGAITNEKLKNDAIKVSFTGAQEQATKTSVELGASLDLDNILNGTIPFTYLNGQISDSQIAESFIDNKYIATSAISNDKIKDFTIANSKLQNSYVRVNNKPVSLGQDLELYVYGDNAPTQDFTLNPGQLYIQFDGGDTLQDAIVNQLRIDNIINSLKSLGFTFDADNRITNYDDVMNEAVNNYLTAYDTYINDQDKALEKLHSSTVENEDMAQQVFKSEMLYAQQQWDYAQASYNEFSSMLNLYETYVVPTIPQDENTD